MAAWILGIFQSLRQIANLGADLWAAIDAGDSGRRPEAGSHIQISMSVALILDKSGEIWYNKLRKCCVDR